MGFMTFIYEDSQYFWKSMPVLLLLVLYDWTMFLIFLRQIPKKRKSGPVHLLLCLALIGAYLALYLQFLEVSRHNLILLVLLNIYVLLTRDITWKHSVFLSSTFILIIELARTFIKDGYFPELLRTWFPALPDLWVNLLILLGGAALIALLVYRLEPIYRKYCTIPLSLWHLILLILPLAIYIYLRSMKFYVMTSETPDTALLSYLQIAELAVSACAIAMTSVLAGMVSAQQEINEHLRMEMLLQNQQQQYLIKTESIEAVKRKYHDLKHIVSGIRAMDQQEAKQFAAALEKEMAPFECIQETGNEMMNILLSEKIRECQEKNIRIVPYIDATPLSFMNELDLCTVFGNAMDNAIEATEKVAEQYREIYIKIHRSGDMMVLCFQNTYDGQVRTVNGKLITSKQNASEHGFGTESIRRIAEKYNGTSAFESEPHVFTLTVLLPIPE